MTEPVMPHARWTGCGPYRTARCEAKKTAGGGEIRYGKSPDIIMTSEK